jgi:DNA-directed RNA polymerase alpha subunit
MQITVTSQIILTFEKDEEKDYMLSRIVKIKQDWDAYKAQQDPQSVNNLGLSVAASNALHDAGLKTVQQVLEKGDKELLKLPNFGRKSLAELRRVLGAKKD